MSAALFPVFLKLAGRRVLVVGGGPVATSKIGALVAAGAEIIVVAPVMTPGIDASACHPSPARVPAGRCRRRVAGGGGGDTRRQSRGLRAPRRLRGVFVNAVDDPPNATAYLGGVVRRAGVTLAISTNGRAPALAGLLREALDAVLPADLERWVAEARAIRPRWIAKRVPMDERRPQLLRALNALYARRTWQTFAQEVWL